MFTTNPKALAQASDRAVRHTMEHPVPMDASGPDLIRAHECTIKNVLATVDETGGVFPYIAMLHWEGSGPSLGLPGAEERRKPVPFWSDFGKMVVATQILNAVGQSEHPSIGVSYIQVTNMALEHSGIETDTFIGYNIRRGGGADERPHLVVQTVEHFGNSDRGLLWLARLVETGDPSKPLRLVPADAETDEPFDWAAALAQADENDLIRPGYTGLTASEMWDMRNVVQPLLLPFAEVLAGMVNAPTKQFRDMVREFGEESGLGFDDAQDAGKQAITAATTYALMMQMADPTLRGAGFPGKPEEKGMEA